MGGGAPAQPAVTSQTTTTSNIPDWLAPYVTTAVGAAGQQVYQYGNVTGPQTVMTPWGPMTQNVTSQQVTGMQPYKPFSMKGTDYVAPLTAGQLAAINSSNALQVPGQFKTAAQQVGGATQQANAATQRANAAAQQALGLGQTAAGAGAQYAKQATTPGSIQAYMSPYMQNVVAQQQREANRMYNITGAQEQAAATRQGAFGGSREAIMAAENERNRNIELAKIQAEGSQQAFQQAQQAQQFGAGLGLQGIQTGLQGAQQGLQGAQVGMQGAQVGLQGAQTLGGLGQAQLGAQQSIIGQQMTTGALQQKQQQAAIDAMIEQYNRAQRYPREQLEFMNAMLRGIQPPNMTQSVYSAQPNYLSQALGGLGAAASMYGATRSKEGGLIKKSVGGEVKAKLYDMTPQQLQQVIQQATSASERSLAKQVLADKSMARGGIVAFANGKEVSRVRRGLSTLDEPLTGEYIPANEQGISGLLDAPENVPVESELGPYSKYSKTTKEYQEAMKERAQAKSRPMNAGQVREELLRRQKMAAEATVPQGKVKPEAKPFTYGEEEAPGKLISKIKYPELRASAQRAVAGKLGSAGIDSQSVAEFANQMIDVPASQYKNPELRSKLLEMFPKPEGFKAHDWVSGIGDALKEFVVSPKYASDKPTGIAQAAPAVAQPTPEAQQPAPQQSEQKPIEMPSALHEAFVQRYSQTSTPEEIQNAQNYIDQFDPDTRAKAFDEVRKMVPGLGSPPPLVTGQQGIGGPRPTENLQAPGGGAGGIDYGQAPQIAGTSYPDIEQQWNQGLDYYRKQQQQAQAEANISPEQMAVEQQASMKAFGISPENEAIQQRRKDLMGERANQKDEAERQGYLRMAEFFAHWGSTPGPVLAAGLKSLIETMPGYIEDKKDQAKLRRSLQDSMYELDQAQRAEKLGLWDLATKHKEKASDKAQSYGNIMAQAQLNKALKEEELRSYETQAALSSGTRYNIAAMTAANKGEKEPSAEIGALKDMIKEIDNNYPSWKIKKFPAKQAERAQYVSRLNELVHVGGGKYQPEPTKQPAPTMPPSSNIPAPPPGFNLVGG